MPTLPAPDAAVKAFSTGTFNAEIIANFWCDDTAQPLGDMALTAFAPNQITGRIEQWNIFTNPSSEINVTEVDTERDALGNQVTAYLKNITVKNITTGRTITNCFAFFDAAAVTLPGVGGAFNLTLVVKRRPSDIYPLFVWVQLFRGKVTVRREVACARV